MNDEVAILVADLGQLDLRPSEQVIYDRPVGLRHLYTDPRTHAEHYLVRYPEGLKARRHRHTTAQSVVVLEGALLADGKVLGAGSYCHFPAGRPQHHEPALGQSCLFVTIFDGPFDVLLDEEEAESPSGT